MFSFMLVNTWCDYSPNQSKINPFHQKIPFCNSKAYRGKRKVLSKKLDSTIFLASRFCVPDNWKKKIPGSHWKLHKNFWKQLENWKINQVGKYSYKYVCQLWIEQKHKIRFIFGSQIQVNEQVRVNSVSEA